MSAITDAIRMSLRAVAKPRMGSLEQIAARELAGLGNFSPFQREALEQVTRNTGRPFGPQVSLNYYDPPRGASERMRQLLDEFNAPGSPMRQRLNDLVDEGVQMGAHKWYDTSPLLRGEVAAATDQFGREVGPGVGVGRFLRFSRVLGDTSPGSAVPMNISRASLFDHALEHGADVPFEATGPGTNYGSLTDGTQRILFADTRQGLPVPIKRRPKTGSFGPALAGNHGPAGDQGLVADRHFLRTVLSAADNPHPNFLSGSRRSFSGESGEFERATNYRKAYEGGDRSVLDEAKMDPSMWIERPTAGEYIYLRNGIAQPLASHHGLTVNQAQAAMWPSAGEKSFMQHFGDVVENTAHERGISFEEAARQHFMRIAPLLSSGAIAALVGELAAQRQPSAAPAASSQAL